MSSDRPRAAPTLHDRLLEDLGLAITSGDLAAGAVLRIEEIERRNGTSRTVVREAIRVLESMQLVTSRRRVGITVEEREHWNVFDPRVIRWRLAGAGRIEQLRSLTELRRAIEPVAARAAADRAKDSERVRLVELTEGLEETGRIGDLAGYLKHDIAFHQLVLAASRNEMFAALGGAVASILAGRTQHHLFPRRPRASSRRAHAEVAQAIRNRDASRAEQTMGALLDGVRDELRRLGAGHETGTPPAAPARHPRETPPGR